MASFSYCCKKKYKISIGSIAHTDSFYYVVIVYVTLLTQSTN